MMMNTDSSLRDLFLLDPDVVFLNHGSFGATPQPVLDVYQLWQRRMERQPVLFLGREIGDHLLAARRALGAFVNAPADDLVFLPNATTAVNVVARSLKLGPGDEVLTTDHEYGACDNAWQFMAQQRGFTVVRQPIPLPLTTDEAIVEQMWQSVTPRTKVIFMSHITSPTAVTMPVAAICARARAEGILTVIDGAHTIGQIPLDLQVIGADFYTSNGHKWLMCPKGCAFLYARPEKQALIEPLIVGWGWGAERTFTFGSDFIDYLQWPGTDDYSAYLSLPAAIQFQSDYDWPKVRESCRVLANDALTRMLALTGLPSIYPTGDQHFHQQMALAPLPDIDDLAAFKNRLYDDYRVEIPCISWNGGSYIRVSIQGYNTIDDVDALIAALDKMLSR